MRDFRRGWLAALPLAPGIAAFGLLYGMMARQAGLSPWEAVAMSMLVHAGSAQFTALGMWGVAGALPIILTTLVVNLRHLLMGASIAPYLRGLPVGWKALLALWMSDESYALSIAEYERGQAPERGYGVPSSHRYFLGVNSCVYVVWAVSGLLGALLGTAIPDPARYGLDLVFPLAFLGLMMAFIKDRTGAVVALAAAVLALLGVYFLPGKWYVIVAGVLGSALGVVLEGALKPCRTS